MTSNQATQIIELLTRIANALDKPAPPAAAEAVPVPAPVPAIPAKPKFTAAPPHALGTGKPVYGRCKYCNAEIIWEETPVGWRPYDPTNPFPLHLCKKRAAQDTADLLPGNPNTPPE